MSVNSKMTALADEIRELSGTTDVMGLDVMATHVGEANDEVDSQAELIAQIKSALVGKGTCGVTLPTLSNPATSDNLEEGYELIDEDGNIVVGTHVCSGGSGDGGNIMYFNVINNLPDYLSVNGVPCEAGESIAIPYNETNYVKTLFWIPYQSEVYSISAPYKQIYEGDDGEMIEEDMDGAPIYSLNEDLGYVTGILMDFWPDPYTVANNTITFEAIYEEV